MQHAPFSIGNISTFPWLTHTSYNKDMTPFKQNTIVWQCFLISSFKSLQDVLMVWIFTLNKAAPLICRMEQICKNVPYFHGRLVGVVQSKEAGRKTSRSKQFNAHL